MVLEQHWWTSTWGAFWTYQVSQCGSNNVEHIPEDPSGSFPEWWNNEAGSPREIFLYEIPQHCGNCFSSCPNQHQGAWPHQCQEGSSEKGQWDKKSERYHQRKNGINQRIRVQNQRIDRGHPSMGTTQGKRRKIKEKG